jgi:hypothetical protein
MKRIPPIAYLAVLLISLVLAYLTWTEGPQKPGGKSTVLECGKGELQKIALREKERKVVYTQRKSSWSGETVWWVEASRLPFTPPEKVTSGDAAELNVDVASMGPAEAAPAVPAGGAGDGSAMEEWTVSESFPGNDKLMQTMEEFCPWQGLRSLGTPGEEKRKEFGLTDTVDSLALELRGKPRTFLIGKSSFGPGDRYIQDEKTGEIFLVTGQSIKNLLYPKSRFMERSLHAFKEDQVVRLRLGEGGRESELVHRVSQDGTDEGWAEDGLDAKPRELYANWVRKVFALRPMDYLVPENGPAEPDAYGCGAPPGASTAASITFLGAKKELGFLTVYKKTGDNGKTEYFACTEKTDAVVLVSKIQAENLLKDMADLLP